MTSSTHSHTQNGFREKPDGETEPAAEVGWYLQRERETLGHSLVDVASELRVDPGYLHALEKGELHHLLEWIYVLSYVRSYSDFLGFEPGPVIRHYKKILSEDSAHSSQNSNDENWPFNEVRARAAIATFAGVVGLMGLAGLVFQAEDATAENSGSLQSPNSVSHIFTPKKNKPSLENPASLSGGVLSASSSVVRTSDVTINLIVSPNPASDIPEVAIREVPLDKLFDEKKSQSAVKRLNSLSLARLAAISEN